MQEDRLTFLEWLEKNIADPFKDWILANYTNPFLWLGLFLIGVIVFSLTYNRLNKNQ